MNTKALLIVVLLAAAAVAGVAVIMNMGSSDTSVVEEADSRTDDVTIDTGEDPSVTNDGDFTVTYESGTADAWTSTSSDGETTITFANITEDTSYSISGNLKGNIVIDAGDYDFELVLNGVTITSTKNVPIYITGDGDVDISAKKDTTNYIYDNRSAVSEDDISASVYSTCDLHIKGKGKLVVVSQNNNGIHSKDDLSVKNLTLFVTCVDNALKGNDSVTITSGNITLNATSGDGIKTTSTDISSKGVQRGTVTINSDDGNTSVTIKAYCDGIDAAFDVVIEETAGNTVSVDIIAGAGATKTTSSLVTGASMSGNRGGPGGMPGMPGEAPGWGGMPGGGGWGQGGPDSEGNSNKTEYSCKGIKADDAIIIRSGIVTIDSFDDCLHANNENSMESKVSPSGDVIISGGKVTLNSKDDGIHADGSVVISGGTVKVTGSYEGLEGMNVTVSGGDVSVVSTDDGVNSTAAVGTGITISGGSLYVYAGGDGLDSNSRTSYAGISFEGGEVTIITTSGGNSSIDSEAGYSYTGGKVLAICPQGMTQEVTKADSWSTKATSTTMNLSSGKTVKVSVNGSTVMSVTMPTSISNAFVVYLGLNSADISAS